MLRGSNISKLSALPRARAREASICRARGAVPSSPAVSMCACTTRAAAEAVAAEDIEDDVDDGDDNLYGTMGRVLAYARESERRKREHAR